ncbi:MAG TPA: GAF domain-containing sensor histidine kinase [Gemmatimonadales bacterium]|nr:GAF domain-containing sensor histidine kinase [Gemmatimonadales bacterium]
MSHPPTALGPVAPPLHERLATLTRRIPQRFGERDFWITQAGVLGVTALHMLIELWFVRGDRSVPIAVNHIPVVLYLAPIAYATLRYGMEGAVLTGLWSGLLMLPNVFLWHREDYQWLEIVYVALVVGMGIVMSLPVEQERLQRQRAEATIQRQVFLNDIATLTLTADLDTTLDQTLRRLSDALHFEAACVAAVRQSLADGTHLSVLAAYPGATVGTDALTASLRCREWLADQPGSVAYDGEDVVVVPLPANIPGPAADAGVDGLLALKVNRAEPLTDDDHRLLAGVASHVAVALANEHLAEAERNRLRSYAMAITRAQEEERKRIARELHDEASQSLVVIRRRLADLTESLGGHPVATELGELGDLAGQTVAGIRRFSRDLRPPTLDELGVSSALEQQVSHFRNRGDAAAEFRVVGPSRRLPTETELALFRIGQAALHNVELHAAADDVEIELAFEPGGVRLSVSDDGCGFEVPQNLDDLPGVGKLGLVGMRERAELVGGTLQLTSRPGAGTRVDVQVPA